MYLQGSGMHDVTKVQSDYLPTTQTCSLTLASFRTRARPACGSSPAAGHHGDALDPLQAPCALAQDARHQRLAGLVHRHRALHRQPVWQRRPPHALGFAEQSVLTRCSSTSSPTHAHAIMLADRYFHFELYTSAPGDAQTTSSATPQQTCGEPSARAAISTPCTI